MFKIKFFCSLIFLCFVLNIKSVGIGSLMNGMAIGHQKYIQNKRADLVNPKISEQMVKEKYDVMVKKMKAEGLTADQIPKYEEFKPRKLDYTKAIVEKDPNLFQKEIKNTNEFAKGKGITSTETEVATEAIKSDTVAITDSFDEVALISKLRDMEIPEKMIQDTVGFRKSQSALDTALKNQDIAKAQESAAQMFKHQNSLNPNLTKEEFFKDVILQKGLQAKAQTRVFEKMPASEFSQKLAEGIFKDDLTKGLITKEKLTDLSTKSLDNIKNSEVGKLYAADNPAIFEEGINWEKLSGKDFLAKIEETGGRFKISGVDSDLLKAATKESGNVIKTGENSFIKLDKLSGEWKVLSENEIANLGKEIKFKAPELKMEGLTRDMKLISAEEKELMAGLRFVQRIKI